MKAFEMSKSASCYILLVKWHIQIIKTAIKLINLFILHARLHTTHNYIAT